MPQRNAALSYVTHTIKVVRGLALTLFTLLLEEKCTPGYSTPVKASLGAFASIPWMDNRKTTTTPAEKIYCSEQAEVEKDFLSECIVSRRALPLALSQLAGGSCNAGNEEVSFACCVYLRTDRKWLADVTSAVERAAGEQRQPQNMC